MSPLWTALSVILASAVFLIFYAVRFTKDLPPGPWGLPIVGYLPWLDHKSPHLSFTKLAEKYGGIYSVRLGSVFAVVLSDEGIIREALALNEFSGRAPLYLTHGIMGGNGIICAQGDKWKEQRKFVTSNLRSFGMVKFGEKRCRIERNIRKGVEVCLEKLENAAGAVDTEPILMHCLGNVIFDLVFGKTWEEDDETWRRLLSYQEEGTKLIGIAGPINFLPLLRFLPKYKKVLLYLRNGIKDSHGIYQEILEEYRRSKSEGADEGEAPHFLAAFEREMSRRGDHPGHYTSAQFNFLMADLWGAGVDTTIATLRWFFLYMATHPKFQVAVQKEMDEVVGGRSLRLSDSPCLPLLRASISEVQRIRSVTPLGFPHGAIESGTVAGYRIPRNSMIIPLQWAVHMNPSLHPRPEVFDPHRFIDADGRYSKTEGFLPFQTGKRMCLGEELAKMLLFLFCGSVLQKFHLSVEGEGEASLEGDVGITLTPKPHKIRFGARKVGGVREEEGEQSARGSASGPELVD